MKVAILSCLKANDVCTGMGCLQAYHDKRDAFSIYKEEETRLMAFMRCNGCGTNPEIDEGMIEKLDRLKDSEVEVVHIGICTVNKAGKLCGTIERIIQMLKDRGIEVVFGTHS